MGGLWSRLLVIHRRGLRVTKLPKGLPRSHGLADCGKDLEQHTRRIVLRAFAAESPGSNSEDEHLLGRSHRDEDNHFLLILPKNQVMFQLAGRKVHPVC